MGRHYKRTKRAKRTGYVVEAARRAAEMGIDLGEVTFDGKPVPEVLQNLEAVGFKKLTHLFFQIEGTVQSFQIARECLVPTIACAAGRSGLSAVDVCRVAATLFPANRLFAEDPTGWLRRVQCDEREGVAPWMFLGNFQRGELEKLHQIIGALPMRRPG